MDICEIDYDYAKMEKVAGTPNNEEINGDYIQVEFQKSGSQSPNSNSNKRLLSSKKKALLRFNSEALERELDVSEINLADRINYSSGLLESVSKMSEQTKINNVPMDLVINKNGKRISP